MDEQELQDLIRHFIEAIVKSFKFPVGKDLLKVFAITVGIFITSLVSTVLGIMHVVSWQGGLLAVIYLGALVIIERGGKREIHRMYQSAKLRFETVKGGQKRPSTDERSEECSNSSTEGAEQNSEREQSNDSEQAG